MDQRITSLARVGLFVIGAQKCGTSSLYDYLARHPQLNGGRAKELHFFDDEGRDWSRPDYRQLETGFGPDDGRICFEATPIYGFLPKALDRIVDYNPSARLIFMFRDPVERAWSHWCMEYARGIESLPFAQAIREGRRRIVREGEVGLRHFSYVERGAYGVQVARAMTRFARHQLLFIESGDLARDHRGVLQRVASFLNIEPFPVVAPIRSNARPRIAYPAWPDGDDCRYILEKLSADRPLFERLTGISTRTWGMGLMRD